MSSFYDRQTNCLTEPERQLVWAFLLLSLDPLSPGMPVEAWDLAWSAAGYAVGERKSVIRSFLGLIDVPIGELTFVVATEASWLSGWVESIADGDSNPAGGCPCDSF